MERESGCKIVVRGKGAIKEGAHRHDGKPLGPEDSEPMHVLIEGPDEDSVERGQALIEQVLNPYSSDAVETKEKQMRELAIINGTLKEEDDKFSPVDWSKKAAVGTLGQPQSWQHTLPPPVSSGGPPTSMDDEYANFLSELSGPRSCGTAQP